MSTLSNKLPCVDQKIENETSLAKKIKGEGLDPSTWENHFREVGIINEEAVQHIDRTTLYKLLRKTTHSWENGALHKLYDKCNLSEITKQENDLKELRKQLPDPRKYLAETLKQDADGRSMAFDDKPYMREIDTERMMRITQKEPSGGQIITRKHLESYDLIRQIAAGQLLRGQFIHENLEQSSIYRKQLIRVDGPIELMSPGISETMEILEFDDKKQSDEFDSVLNQCGVSFALGFCGRIPFVARGNAKGSFDYTQTEQRKTSMNWQEHFVKVNQFLIVPTASFTLSNQNVCLSECALDALKRLNGKGSNDDDDCNLFFKEFGSHFYTGVWHFGGRYKWSVTSITDSQNNRSENYQKAKRALSGSVGGGFRWFGGEGKGAFEKDKEKVTETQTFSEKFKVAKKLEKFGGPQEADDISLWKKGLAEHNKTWVIIDKDVSQKCYKGVWTLLEGQENTFPGADSIIKKLKTAWENIYNNTKSDAKMDWCKQQIYLDKPLESSSADEGKVKQRQSIGLDEHTQKDMDELLFTRSGPRQFAEEYSRTDSKSQKSLHEKLQKRLFDSNK